jgi:sugar/nucleoside kinase (ribokinase family)
VTQVEKYFPVLRDFAAAPVVVGFDGFVDEMVRLVAKRTSLETFEAVPDIAAFGALVSASAGHSCLREIVVHAVHPGGCAVNLGDGLAALGIPVDCYATLGEPVHPAFQPVVARFRKSVSWGREPGRTIAFEFADGKMMFSSVRQLADFSPAEVESRLADGGYARSCREARVIALTDWTLFPHMTGVWELLAERVFATLEHRPYFFIDLVDPSGRSVEDILSMAKVLPAFEKCGSVCLGLNGNEANILARIFSFTEARDPESTENLAARLRESLGISRVVVHRPAFAVEAGETGVAFLTVPLCEKPAKSTGAGDRFNAGYILGLLSGCEAETRLQMACAVSGFFVRSGHSPSRSELQNFLLTPPGDS